MNNTRNTQAKSTTPASQPASRAHDTNAHAMTETSLTETSPAEAHAHLSRAATTRLPMTPSQILGLQRTVGNRRVQRLLAAQHQTTHPSISATNKALVQRSIVPDGKGGYINDETDEPYAFVTQASTGKTWLFAHRDDLEKLRTELFKNSIQKKPSTPEERTFSNREFRDKIKESIDGTDETRQTALKPFRRKSGSMQQDKLAQAEKAAATAVYEYATGDEANEVTKLLFTLRFVIVDDEDNVIDVSAKDPEIQALLHKITAVVIQDEKQDEKSDTHKWGHGAPKKPGFGERAPKAAGTLYINTDSGMTEEKAYKLLTSEAKNKTKYDGVTTTALDNTAYATQFNLSKAAALVLSKHENEFFYVSTASRTDNTRTKGAKYLIGNVTYGTTGEIDKNKEAINKLYKPLETDRSVQDWAEVKNPGSRSGTQAQAMDNWNALGAAAYAKQVLGRNDIDVNQDYEWLHIKGVQNGGRNEKKNLGTGTWVSNSMMIPFENQIRQWANAKTGKISARYTAETKPANSPVLDKITIQVAATADHEIGPIDKSDPLEVTFEPQKDTLKDTFSNKFGTTRYKLKGLKRQQDRAIRQAFDGKTVTGDKIAANITELIKSAPKRAARLLMDRSGDEIKAVAGHIPVADLASTIEIAYSLHQVNATRLLLYLSDPIMKTVLDKLLAATTGRFVQTAFAADIRFAQKIMSNCTLGCSYRLHDLLPDATVAALFNAMSDEDFISNMKVISSTVKQQAVWLLMTMEKRLAYLQAMQKKKRKSTTDEGSETLKKTKSETVNMDIFPTD